jgi:hypothetical protein
MTDRGFWVTGLAKSLNVRRLMYQPLIWSAVHGNEARRLGTALDAEDLQRLADTLVDGVRRNIELARDFLGRQMLVDKAQAIELSGSQARDALLNLWVGRLAAWPPIGLRQAVPILPSDSRPAQHFTQPPEHRVLRVTLMTSSAVAPDFQRICGISG